MEVQGEGGEGRLGLHWIPGPSCLVWKPPTPDVVSGEERPWRGPALHRLTDTDQTDHCLQNPENHSTGGCQHREQLYLGRAGIQCLRKEGSRIRKDQKPQWPRCSPPRLLLQLPEGPHGGLSVGRPGDPEKQLWSESQSAVGHSPPSALDRGLAAQACVSSTGNGPGWEQRAWGRRSAGPKWTPYSADAPALPQLPPQNPTPAVLAPPPRSRVSPRRPPGATASRSRARGAGWSSPLPAARPRLGRLPSPWAGADPGPSLGPAPAEAGRCAAGGGRARRG